MKKCSPKSGSTNFRTLGYSSFQACVKAGGKPSGGKPSGGKKSTARKGKRRSGVTVNGKRYMKVTGKKCYTRKQISAKKKSLRKAINRTL